jgi:hypothetical protein
LLIDRYFAMLHVQMRILNAFSRQYAQGPNEYNEIQVLVWGLGVGGQIEEDGK